MNQLHEIWGQVRSIEYLLHVGMDQVSRREYDPERKAEMLLTFYKFWRILTKLTNFD